MCPHPTVGRVRLTTVLPYLYGRGRLNWFYALSHSEIWVWVWIVSQRVMCLSTSFPVGDVVWELCGTSQSLMDEIDHWGQAWGFIICFHFLITLCFLTFSVSMWPASHPPVSAGMPCSSGWIISFYKPKWTVFKNWFFWQVFGHSKEKNK